MLLTVDTAGYHEAATAFAGGNEVAALQHHALVGRLAAVAGMAGSDSTAEQFAAAYDAAAGDAVGGLADLVGAFATLGRITSLSAANHEHAEAASVLMPGATVYDPAASPTGTPLTVLPASLPSSLGGDPPYLTPLEQLVLDHVGGFLWPNADTDRLRDAASVWRSAAESLHVLADHCTSAATCLETQRSPEIPLAVATTLSLRATIGDLTVAFADLAAHCDAYAAHVDAAHAELRALLHEIVLMVEEQIAISAALSVVSAGLGTAAGLATLALRIAREAPAFARIIAALRTLADGTALAVRGTHDVIRLKRVELARFLRVPARNEYGVMRIVNTVRPTPKVESEKVQNIVNNLFKGTTNPARVGDGTTMAAIRQERMSGLPTHGKIHFTKGVESLRGLEKWLRQNPHGTAHDREVVEGLIKELKEVLGR